MSDGTEVEAGQEEDKAAAKRKTLSLGERIKVVDFLRSQVEPIVADSNAAVAALVSTGSGVEINWQQLKYMIDDLEELKLGSKVHVKSLLSGEDERWAAMEARVAKIEAWQASILTQDRIDAIYNEMLAKARSEVKP